MIRPEKPLVIILLGTHNGAAYLEELLSSLDQQTHSDWILLVSDHNSNDATLTILRNFTYKPFSLAPRMILTKFEEESGACGNFIHLLKQVDLLLKNHPILEERDLFFAFCDQDDIWDKAKIERAISSLKPLESAGLYCSRSSIVDSSKKIIGKTPLFSKSFSFQNALVQNVVQGHTAVFNYAVYLQIKNVLTHPISLPFMHDWFLYLIVSYFNGVIHYDPISSVLYRQHEANRLGAKNRLSTYYDFIKAANSSRHDFIERVEQNLLCLKSCPLIPKNDSFDHLIDEMLIALKRPKLFRLHFLIKNRLYRQNSIETLLLYAVF